MDMNQYRVLSVHAKDYNTIMNWAHPSAYTGEEIVSIIIEHYKKTILSIREKELESIYYSSDKHKKLFDKHLEIDQFSNYKSDNLLCFYINSFLGLYIEDINEPMAWIGKWDEDHKNFEASTQYKKLEEDKKMLVDYANVLIYETDPLCILKVFSHIENKNVVLAQEMLRLKFLRL